MPSGWNYALSPTVCKTLLGSVGFAFFLVAAAHQPWVPIDWGEPETGTLAAMPVPVRPFVETSPPESSAPANEHKIAAAPLPTVQQTAHVAAAPSPLVVTATNVEHQPHEALPALHLRNHGADAPRSPGNPTPPVPMPRSPPEWPLGRPTVAYQLPEPFQIPPSEAGLQWSFVIPTGVRRDLFLTGADLRPGHVSLVKRMILSYDATGQSRRQDRQQPQPGYLSTDDDPIPVSRILAEWTPGTSATAFPKGTAYRIPAGADLVLTVHYAATKTSVSDPWKMGLYFARVAPDQRLGQKPSVSAQ